MMTLYDQGQATASSEPIEGGDGGGHPKHIMAWKAASLRNGRNNAYIAILGGGAPHTAIPTRRMSRASCLGPE